MKQKAGNGCVQIMTGATGKFWQKGEPTENGYYDVMLEGWRIPFHMHFFVENDVKGFIDKDGDIIPKNHYSRIVAWHKVPKYEEEV